MDAPNIFLDLARQYGIAASMVAFFVWRDYKREICMTKQRAELEVFIHTSLMDVIEKNHEILVKFTQAVGQCTSRK